MSELGKYVTHRETGPQVWEVVRAELGGGRVRYVLERLDGVRMEAEAADCFARRLRDCELVAREADGGGLDPATEEKELAKELSRTKAAKECARASEYASRDSVAAALAPGDVVCLRSGGPAMTVTGESAAGLACAWFEVAMGVRVVRREAFPAAALARDTGAEGGTP